MRSKIKFAMMLIGSGLVISALGELQPRYTMLVGVIVLIIAWLIREDD